MSSETRQPGFADRQEETRRFGRDVAYSELSGLLPEKQREAFELINVALADLDDLIDTSGRSELVSEAVGLFTASFEGRHNQIGGCE